MTIRERQEQQEKLLLAPWAARSAETAGRDIPVEPCDLRTEYQRDRDRIQHLPFFRKG